MNMDLDLNLAGFQFFDGFGLNLDLINYGIGFDSFVWNFFATFSSVSELNITAFIL